MVEKPATGFTSAGINSDSRHRMTWNVNADYASNDRGGWGTDFSLGATYRPGSNVSASFDPSWSSNKSLLRYVTVVRDPLARAFSGSRYVLSALRQKQLALDTRLSVTFSPTMTFELYAQPVVASGDYFDFKEFDAPRSGAYRVFGSDHGTIVATRRGAELIQYAIDLDGAGLAQPFNIGNPNFVFRSLRGNAVFRWEYHPGSTLYVAWTHSRSDTEPFGDFDLARDRQGLFATRPDNIFLVQATWGLAR